MSWIDYAQGLLDKSWLGTLLGIAGITFAVLTYLWTRRRTSLAYVYLGEHLLGSASDALPPEIVVQYDGMSIPRLTKSTLIFWNSGENTVSGADIVDKDPLRFRVGDDGKILSISIVRSSRAVNDFSFRELPDHIFNEMGFTFNFLDANDGVVVEILHTSTDRHPLIKGTLKGLPAGIRNFGQFTRPKPQKKKTGKLGAIASDVVPFIVFVSIYLSAIYAPRPSFFSQTADTGLIFYSFAGAVSGMWITSRFFTRRRYPKSLVTEALE
ncbi:hypothetical protein HX873_29320 [Pseudomonas sp. P7758]|uniref:hypothetical protein n=1 Tax=unclassified Pseudomonas TaxID=196821 RepID=UPI0015A093E3|nr:MULTISPECIES: hypothetical protein [unclassified Pseudomonas]NWC72005.1 hypothetical protein [Pseudomonas sp. P7758]NWD63835.1 hypothetical protein [Pseudomonas sp. IPO3774]